MVCQSGLRGLCVDTVGNQKEKERGSVITRHQQMGENRAQGHLFRRWNVLGNTVNVSHVYYGPVYTYGIRISASGMTHHDYYFVLGIGIYMKGKIGIILNDSLLTSCRWPLFQQRWDLVRGLHLVDALIRVVAEWKKEDADVENLHTAATDHAFKGNDATNTVVQARVHFSPTPNHLTGKILWVNLH